MEFMACMGRILDLAFCICIVCILLDLESKILFSKLGFSGLKKHPV